jgi:hypothetical protein
MRSASGSEPVREPEEVFLVDGVQHHDGGAPDDLVFQGGDRRRPLSPVHFRYVRPAGRLGPVRSAMDPSMQIDEPWLKVCLVVVPRHAIHAGGGLALERVERQPERVDVDVVEKRGEPFQAAGFKLPDLREGQPAGLIGNQLRVALRTSRFVIADLTHNYNGAYWEAGFAEGLGRPLIYTCRKQEWDANKSHFDTSHLNTIIWDPENLRDAGTRLTATIRATLPSEAKMTD